MHRRAQVRHYGCVQIDSLSTWFRFERFRDPPRVFIPLLGSPSFQPD